MTFAGSNAARGWSYPHPSSWPPRSLRSCGARGRAGLNLRTQRCLCDSMRDTALPVLGALLQLAAAMFAMLRARGCVGLNFTNFAGHSAFCAGSSPPAGGREIRKVGGAGQPRRELRELRGTQRFLWWELLPFKLAAEVREIARAGCAGLYWSNFAGSNAAPSGGKHRAATGPGPFLCDFLWCSTSPMDRFLDFAAEHGRHAGVPARPRRWSFRLHGFRRRSACPLPRPRIKHSFAV